MNSIRYALLSLLAREPLSGYDIKQHMNGRLGPFWKVGSNQVYPELSKLEGEGLIRLLGVEQLSYRPARKVYELTDSGREALAEWVLEPAETEFSLRDDFILKAYNLWLVEPEQMIRQLERIQQHHEAKLAAYLDKSAELERALSGKTSSDPLYGTAAVLDFGIRHERQYLEWCQEWIRRLDGEGAGPK
ncbi:PadR family transcriptional regulator [Paenibacillus mucilaginosus]|uniref:PadR family transcriptional regulator n=2 Tax=Paenibacillus mucilaginosus TaxID=61624 RepID=H6NLB9_9BACL|nr:PadR family transcriptional regulator [Paenibacillus mucilaginosus]AEI41802.1 hypothetical protein KNP414_03244 [Paenibacillus mucilaginosus KNP414]AFC30301.1 hypothetical protein PM3016_3468 [Paenibacillus mucilaginosus 3016]MCG7214485.1 PadR family transcriptional regulator [Paenibacillus mucilaginosus]WDM30767.1 PadR family transcriptional regulator [Paenibacillus mucilaginosus]WFA18942.1 PadR family transcriptional regulator [Paenibacillus mucilaginosus]